MRSKQIGLVAGLIFSSSIGSLYTQSITWIGRPNNGQYSPTVTFFANLGNISKDGSRLVQASDYPLAFMWERSYGWRQIGGFLYNAVDISGDGSIIVGIAPTGNQVYSMPALYYRSSATWQPLGLPSGFRSGAALCISWNGTTIAGSLGLDSSGAAVERPFVYRNGAYTLLPIPPDNPNLVYAVGTSPEGEVIVGTAAYEDTAPVHALRWDSQGLTILPKPTPDWGTWAVDASANGEAIIGGGVDNLSGSYRPLLWQNGAVTVLPTGSFAHGVAHRVSQTGQVATGTAFTDQFAAAYAVRWSACGFENLNTAYAHLLGSNEVLLTAHALTRSGQYIAGIGSRDGGNTLEMYVLDTNRCWDPPGNVDTDCCVEDADLLQVLFDFGNTGTGRPTDLNCDGIVDDTDLLIVLFNFGQGC